MKLEAHGIEMTARLSLTEREVVMLEELSSYGLADIIRKHVTQQFTEEELKALFGSLQGALGRLREHFNGVRQVYMGEKQAAPWPRKETPHASVNDARAAYDLPPLDSTT